MQRGKFITTQKALRINRFRCMEALPATAVKYSTLSIEKITKIKNRYGPRSNTKGPWMVASRPYGGWYGSGIWLEMARRKDLWVRELRMEGGRAFHMGAVRESRFCFEELR